MIFFEKTLLTLWIVVFVVIFLPGMHSFARISPTSRKDSSLLAAGKPVTVTFEPSGKVITAEQGDNLAEVAARAKVFIPFKCKQGRCNSCELRLNGRGRSRINPP